MPELRWILAAAGVIFLIALAVWESRRQRRLPPHVEESTHHRFREVAPELPVVEIDESMVGLRVDGVRIEDDMVAVDAPARDTEAILDSAEEGAASAPRHAVGRREALEASAEPVAPIVEWPPENERRLVTLRVVAKAGERLSGRAVRLALAAEGFVHGKFSIFHKPGADGRVTVSAASLSKPGNFDLNTMDSQRYGGLGLFTVLPGHLPPRQMVDELLEATRNLGERLDAVVQDERAAPLDAERIAALRTEAEAPAAAAPAAPADPSP
jgi:FtsZ-interacting cell division protein ZipA